MGIFDEIEAADQQSSAPARQSVFDELEAADATPAAPAKRSVFDEMESADGIQYEEQAPQNPKRAFSQAVNQGNVGEAILRFPSALRYAMAGPNAEPYSDSNPRPTAYKRDPQTGELVPEDYQPEKTSLVDLAQQGFVYGVVDPIDAVGNVVGKIGGPEVERYDGPRPVAIEEGAGTGRKVAGAVAQGAGDIAAKAPAFIGGMGAARGLIGARGAAGRIATDALGAAVGGAAASPHGQTLEGAAVNAATGGGAALFAKLGQVAAARLIADGATEGSARAVEKAVNIAGGALAGGGAAVATGAEGEDIAAQALLGGAFGAVQPKSKLPERELPGANAKMPEVPTAELTPQQKLDAEIRSLRVEADSLEANGNAEQAQRLRTVADVLEKNARQADTVFAQQIERGKSGLQPDEVRVTPKGELQLPPSFSRETPPALNRPEPRLTEAGTVDLGVVNLPPKLPGEAVPNAARSDLDARVQLAPELPGEPVTETAPVRRRRPLVASAILDGDTVRIDPAEPGPPPGHAFIDPEILRAAQERRAAENRKPLGTVDPEVIRAAQERMGKTPPPEPEPPSPPPPEPPAPEPDPVPPAPDPAPAPVPVPVETGATGEAAPNPTVLRNFKVVEMPTEQIQSDPQTYQFKRGVDKKGVRPGEELAGEKYERAGTAPLLVYERTDGRTFVVNGHHRLELAQRVGEPSVPVQVIREADGITPEQARMIGAEINIRDTTGSVEDYAGFFRERKTSQAEAEAKGLLARDKGRAGFTIGNNAGENLFTLFMNKGIPADKARAIAEAVPRNERVQNAAIDYFQRDPKATPTELANFSRALDFNSRSKSSGATEGDLFGGFDDSAIQDSLAMGKAASSIISDITDQIRAVENAAKRPEQAKKLGVDVTDPASILGKVQELKAQRAAWEKWPSNPQLVETLKRVTNLAEAEGAPVQDVPGFGDRNTIFTRQKRDAAAQRLDDGEMLAANPFANPEYMRDAGIVAGYYAEAVGRDFAAWSKRMVNAYGPGVEKYLPELWKAATAGDAPQSSPAPASRPSPDGESGRPLTEAEQRVDPKQYYNEQRFGGSLAAQAELEYQIRKSAVELGLAPNQKQSFEQWLQEAQKFEADPKFFEKIKRGFDPKRIPSLPEQLAARNVMTTLTERLGQLEAKQAELLARENAAEGSVPKADLENVALELDTVQRDLQSVTDFFIPMRSQAGRNLVMYRILSRQGADPTIQVARAARAKGGKLTAGETKRITELTAEVAAARQSGDTARINAAETALASYQAALAKTPIITAISNTGKAGLLTSLRTVVRNVGGNTSFAALVEFERNLAAMADALMAKSTGERQVLSRMELLSSPGELVREAGSKAWRDAKHVMRHGFTQNEMAKNLEAMSVLREQNTGIKAWDAAVNSIFRFQAAQDLPYRWWHFLTALEEQSILQARREQKAGALTGSVQDRAIQIRNMLSEGRVIKAVANMEEAALLENILKIAREDAAVNTFTSNKTAAGQVARYISQRERAAQDSGPLGQTVSAIVDRYLPFKRTPFNIAGEILRRMGNVPAAPITAGYAAWVRKNLTPQQQKLFAYRMTRGSLSSGLIFLGYSLAANGLLTSTREPEPGKRDLREAAGLQPGAIRAGGKTYRVGDLFSPLSNLVMFGSMLFHEYTRPLTGQEGSVERLIEGTTRTVADNPFFQGVETIMDFKREGGLERLVSAGLSSMIPTVVADTAATMDEFRRDTRPVPGAPAYENLTKAAQERIPVLRERLPVRRDALGQTQKTSAWNLLNPTFPTVDQTKRNPLIAEMIANDIALQKPRREDGETAADFEKRQIEGGERIQKRGSKRIETKSYQKRNAVGRGTILEEIVREERGHATKKSDSAQDAKREEKKQKRGLPARR